MSSVFADYFCLCLAANFFDYLSIDYRADWKSHIKMALYVVFGKALALAGATFFNKHLNKFVFFNKVLPKSLIKFGQTRGAPLLYLAGHIHHSRRNRARSTRIWEDMKARKIYFFDKLSPGKPTITSVVIDASGKYLRIRLHAFKNSSGV